MTFVIYRHKLGMGYKVKKSTFLIIIVGSFSAENNANAAQIAPTLCADSISINTSMGMLGGTSRELVYDASNARKISQLDWKIKNVAILKADFSWDAYSFLTLSARGWTSLASGTGHMDDYDWQNSRQSTWTDHSSHPATDVNYANEYDLNAKGWFLQGDDYHVGAVAGYQETRFSWTASGGSYHYDNGTLVGDFPNGEAGIGYSQRFSMPYIGLVGRYRINDFELNALFKFSDWVRARDNDEHYMRDLTFREQISGSRYYGISIDAGYYVTRSAKVFTEFTYSRYEESRGGTQIIDNISGQSASFDGDAAGITNSNYTVTVGLQYRF